MSNCPNVQITKFNNCTENDENGETDVVKYVPRL